MFNLLLNIDKCRIVLLMAHIHTNPGEHDPTASAFIIRTDTVEPKLLLHVHKKLGVLLQTGGHIEVTETPWQAVCHEITEETGYKLDQLKILQPPVRIKSLTGASLHPQPVVHNTHNFDPEGIHKHTDISYAFITEGDPQNRPDEGESVIFRWVDVAELRAIETNKIFENVREIGKFVLTEILSKWEAVDLTDFEN